MKSRKLGSRNLVRVCLPVLLAACAGLASPLAGPLGLGERAAMAAPPRGPVDAPQVATLVPLFDGLKWGMTHLEVVDAYNRVGGLFDREYDPMLRRLQPGVQQKAVEAERDARKSSFERSFLEFKDTPTGYDTTSLKGEYSYRNHESIMAVELGGKKRYFFFIGPSQEERLWKIYDEVPLAEGGLLGKTYADALTRYQGKVGAAPRAHAAEPDKGSPFANADWQDANTHLRLLDRSQGSPHVVAVVLEDRRTLGSLASLRSNKAEDPLAMDPSITAITRGGITDPNAQAAPQPKPPKK